MDYIKGFFISFILHAAVVFAIVYSSVSIAQKPVKPAVIDISMVMVEPPPAPEPIVEAPAPLPPPTLTVVKETPKPKLQPKPVAVEKEETVKYEKAVEESVALIEPESEEVEVPFTPPEPARYDSGHITGTVQSREPSEDEIRAGYVKSNYAYIQKLIKRSLVYPDKAKRSNIRGKVTIVFTINGDGTVCDVGVNKSSGHDLLDKAGMEAVYNAAPFPAPPVSAKIVVPIDFVLM